MKPSSSGDNSIRKDSCSANTSPLDCRTFNDWGELRSFLIKAYELEDVVIQVRPEYVHSETIDRLDQSEIREVSDDEALLSLSVGLRASLDVHLFKKSTATASRSEGQLRSDFNSILICAKNVFCRTVRDRVVELMSSRRGMGVVSFFLDSEGRVESASNKAREFCDRYFPSSKRGDDYFPQSHWEYLQGAIRSREAANALSYKNESLVFCFYQESGMIDCLLQKMGGSGYLLSLAAKK